MRDARPAALLAIALAGCSLAPAYQRPAPPVAEGWPTPPAPSGSPRAAAAAVAAADMGWRDVFGDARLQALVAVALQNNRDLRATALNVELTRAQYRIQRAELLPSAGAVASASAGRTPADLNTTGRAVTATAYAVGAGITNFELDLFGRVRSLSAAALEAYLATEEARRGAQLALVGEVVNQELARRAFDEEVVLARQTLVTVENSLQLARRTFEAGRSSELDLRTAEAQLETARVNLSAAEVRRARAENALVLLLGAQLPAALPPSQPLDSVAIVAELPVGVPSDVLLRRPDILAAEHALRSANASIGAARAAFFPSITLTGNGGTASASLSGLFGSGSGAWSFIPRISLPLFTGGALRAGLDVAETRKSIQVARYEGAIQAAFREVSDALAARGALDVQLGAQMARVKAETRRYELSEKRYRGGVDSYLNVLTAQRDLFAAQQGLIETRLSRLANLVDLYRTLGGGWKERTGAERASSGPGVSTVAVRGTALGESGTGR